MRDYGIRISPDAEHGPLWNLSPRALRLWLYLAMKAQHATITQTMPDRQRVTVNRGQWLTSTRRLRAEGLGSVTSITSALDELEAAEVVTFQAIPRSENQNGGVPKIKNGGAS